MTNENLWFFVLLETDMWYFRKLNKTLTYITFCFRWLKGFLICFIYGFVSQNQAWIFYGWHKELRIQFSPYNLTANKNLKFRMRTFVTVLAVLLLIHTTYAQDNGVSTTKKCEDVLAQNVRIILMFLKKTTLSNK